ADENADRHDYPFEIPGFFPHPGRERGGDGDDGQLPDFHAQVEAEQNLDEPSLRQAQFPQNPREAQSVDESESEYENPARGFELPEEDVLGGHHRDRKGDERLDYGCGQGEYSQYRHAQGDGMGDGEGGNLDEQGPKIGGKEEQPEHEKDMVEAVGKDMGEPEDDETPNHGFIVRTGSRGPAGLRRTRGRGMIGFQGIGQNHEGKPVVQSDEPALYQLIAVIKAEMG